MPNKLERRRLRGEGSMDKVPWGRLDGEGQKARCKRLHGEGSVEEASWRRLGGQGSMEKAKQRRLRT